MPLFTAIGVATATGLGLTVAGSVAVGAAALTTAGTFIAGATAFGLQMAVGIGLSMLAQQVAGTPADPGAATATGPGFGIQGKLSSGADQPRSFHLGWRATAGSLVYANTWKLNNQQQTPNAYLTQVIAISDLPLRRGGEDGSLHIHALKRLWVDGALCTVNLAEEDATLGFPINEYRDVDNDDFLWVRFYDGTQTAADTLCTDKVASAARPYASTRVGKGVAYAVMTAKVNEKKFSGFPQYKFEVYGRALYDVSKDTTAGGSGSHLWADPATWGGDGDDLPVVQIYNLLRGITYNDEWVYGLQGLTAARLPAANWIAQIEKCRTAVDDDTNSPPTTGATYRASAEVFVNNDLASTIEALLTACQGRLSEVGGVYTIHCGAIDAPVASFTDGDIISTEEQSFTPFHGLSDTINGVTARYPSPDEGWNMQTAPPIYRSDLEAQAGNRRLLADVALETVPYARQVQQLMQEALQEAQRARRHTITLPPKFWKIEPGDIVEWTSDRNGYTAKSFRVDGVVDKANLEVIVDITEVNEADYDWDTSTDYTPPVIGPGDPGIIDVDDQAVDGFAVSGVIVTDETGAIKRPAIRVEWSTEGLEDVVGIQLQVRKADEPETTIIDTTVPDVALGYCILQAGAILSATDYEVRGKYVPTTPNRNTLWTSWFPVTTPDVRFEFADLEPALANYLRQYLLGEFAELREAYNALALNVSELRNTNYSQKLEERRLLQVAEGGLSASITQLETVIIGPGGALATLETDIAATYATLNALNEEIETRSALSEDFTAFAGPGGTFANFALELESTYATIDALGAVEDTASQALDEITTFAGPGGTFAEFLIDLESTYATQTALGEVSSVASTVSTNFNTFAGSGGTFAQYQQSMTSTVIPNAISAGQQATLNIVAGTYATQSNLTTVNNLAGSVRDYVNAYYAISLDVNGVIAGFRLFNNGVLTAIKFNVDIFQIASATENKVIFEVGNVNGVSTIKFRGTMYGDGDIHGRAIIANSIEANRIKVGGTAANLIANGDFEVPATAGNSLADTWVNSGSGSISLGQGSNSRSANGHLIVSKPINAASAVVAAGISANFFPVEPSRTYEAAVYMKGSAASPGGGFIFNVHWYSITNTLLSTSAIVNNGPITTSYVRQVGQVTSPSNAAYGKVSFVNNGSSSAAQHLYIDDANLRLAINTTEIIDDAITTGKIMSDQVLTRHLRAEAATALFGATGADLTTLNGIGVESGSGVTRGYAMVNITVNVEGNEIGATTGECLLLFDAEFYISASGASANKWVDVVFIRRNNAVTPSVDTEMFARRFRSTDSNNDARIRGASIMRYVTLPVGTHTIYARIYSTDFANNASVINAPTIALMESRR